MTNKEIVRCYICNLKVDRARHIKDRTGRSINYTAIENDTGINRIIVEEIIQELWEEEKEYYGISQ